MSVEETMTWIDVVESQGREIERSMWKQRKGLSRRNARKLRQMRYRRRPVGYRRVQSCDLGWNAVLFNDLSKRVREIEGHLVL